MVGGNQPAQPGQTGGHDVEHGLMAVERDLLRQMGHARARTDPDYAVIGRGLAAHQAQQRGLALAVAPHQADALPAGDLEFRPVQQGVVAEGQGNLVEAQQGHGRRGSDTVVGGDDPEHPDPCMRPGLIFREGYIDGDGDGQNDCSSPPPHAYQHPGGMQRVGTIMAMAMDTPRNLLAECYASCVSSDPDEEAICRLTCENTVHYEMASSPSRIMFFDVINPENPEFKSQFVPVHSDGKPLHDADGLAVTRLPNGLYLMAVGSGFHGDEPIYFDRSSSNELGSKDLTWELVGTVHDINDHDEDAHQSLHFLREGNIEGPLYLAGSRGHPVFGAITTSSISFRLTASLRTARPWARSPSPSVIAGRRWPASRAPEATASPIWRPRPVSTRARATS